MRAYVLLSWDDAMWLCNHEYAKKEMFAVAQWAWNKEKTSEMKEFDGNTFLCDNLLTQMLHNINKF